MWNTTSSKPKRYATWSGIITKLVTKCCVNEYGYYEKCKDKIMVDIRVHNVYVAQQYFVYKTGNV